MCYFYNGKVMKKLLRILWYKAGEIEYDDVESIRRNFATAVSYH